MRNRLNSGNRRSRTDGLFYLSVASLGLGAVLYPPLFLAGAVGVVASKILENHARSYEERRPNRSGELDYGHPHGIGNRHNWYRGMEAGERIRPEPVNQ